LASLIGFRLPRNRTSSSVSFVWDFVQGFCGRMANIDIEGILRELPSDGRVPKTKIVCTLGPASRSVPMLEKLLRAGMNVARFNFSHGTHEYHQETLDNLRVAMHNTQILCAVMLDTKVVFRSLLILPLLLIYRVEMVFYRVSIGLTDECVKITDAKCRFAMSQHSTMTALCWHDTLLCFYKKLPLDLKPGNSILCADGTITMTVLSCDPGAGTVRCRCENTAKLGERKNVNLPGVVVDLPTLTEKDKEDILGWGVPNNIDMIALSFVRKGSDLVTVRKVLGPNAKSIKLMSKVCIPNPDCHAASYRTDGTDCVMLSGESAAGAYPELAVKIMARICIEAESSLDYEAIFKEMIRSTPLPMSPLESLASSAVRTANKARAMLIVVLTRGGTTAKLVAKYRPRVPILSVVVPVLTTDSFDWSVSDESPARHSLIYRGLVPLLAEGSAKATDSESTEMILEAALRSAVEKRLCKPGDAVVALHRIGVASVIKICIVK
ncbi:hypothetical protein B296_00026098, partial [Ensete ventricosum]